MIISIGSEFMKGDIIREDIIRTKMAEIEESINLMEEYLPEDVEGFLALMLVKDGIYKRIETTAINIQEVTSTNYGNGDKNGICSESGQAGQGCSPCGIQKRTGHKEWWKYST